MANKPANAKQKKWMRDISDFIQAMGIDRFYGDEFRGGNFELHHVLGRSAKHNKVAIGHEFIIPVPFELHNVSSDHPDNVTHFKHNFTNRFKMQRDIFNDLYIEMADCGYQIPSADIRSAIMDTNA